jgi:outer membrane protein TolC
MRRQLVVGLAGLCLVSSPPCAAGGDGVPDAAGAPTTAPALLRESVERLGTDLAVDLDRLKQTLTQAPVAPGAPPPPAAPAPAAETLELTLEKSLEIALKKNLPIRIDEFTRQALETEIARARAAFHPTVGLAYIQSRSREFPRAARSTVINTTDVSPRITTRLPTGGTLDLIGDVLRTEDSTKPETYGSAATLTLTQPLLRGGRFYVATRPIQDARFDVKIQGEQLRAQILRVTASTKSAYYNLLLAERIIEATESALQRDKLLIESSEALFKAGLVTRRDVLSAAISQAKDQARLVGAQGDLELARNTLAEILGLPIGTAFALLDREIGFRAIPLDLESWLARALKERPEVRAIQEAMGKSELNVRVARNALLPQLDFVASYGRAHERPVLADSLHLDGYAWSAGLVLTFPLGNVAARSALTRAEIEHTRLQHEREQVQRLIEVEVRTAVVKLRKSLDEMKAQTVVFEQAKEKLEVAKARFALGLATNLDITDAQEDILNAETDLLRALVDYNVGLAELESSIAGSI